MHSLLERVRMQVYGRLFPLIFRCDVKRPDLIRLGSAYGGWWVPATMISMGSVCYCAGVGEDITFDEALITKFGCRVWAMDPTPRSIAWVGRQDVRPGFTFVPVGVAGSDTTLRFYEPKDASWVSHSIANLGGTERYFEADCRTIQTLMNQFGHDRLDLLKLDVEGAEHMVIDSLLRDGILPRVLCVEFDQPEPLRATRRTVAALRRAGYKLAKVDWFNMTFVRARPQQDVVNDLEASDE